jgi:hypothetical protein
MSGNINIEALRPQGVKQALGEDELYLGIRLARKLENEENLEVYSESADHRVSTDDGLSQQSRRTNGAPLPVCGSDLAR